MQKQQKQQKHEPNATSGNGYVFGCLIGAVALPLIVTGAAFLFVGVDGQFGLTMVILAPVGAVAGGIIGAASEAMRKRNG